MADMRQSFVINQGRGSEEKGQVKGRLQFRIRAWKHGTDTEINIYIYIYNMYIERQPYREGYNKRLLENAQRGL